MALALFGQLWAPAMVLGMPPKEAYEGGCCATTCCVKEDLAVTMAAKAEAVHEQVDEVELKADKTPDTKSSL